MDSQLLDPAVEFERARILMEDKQFERAVQYLKKACDYDPQNGLYRAALAYCWFQIDPVNTAQDSIPKLKRALRLDPDCGLTHYYLGEVYRRVGSFDEAEEHLREASKLMPTDRRPVDALKEISIEHREIQQQKDNESAAPRQRLAGWQER